MSFRTQSLTMLPALCLFVMSSYFAFLTFQVVDPSVRQGLLTLALSFFIGGVVLTLYWAYSWVISKRLQESKSGVMLRIFSLTHLIGLSLIAFGSITLAWVGQLTWHDMTAWGKDIALIFFSSRTGENISLGIGMRVIHYFLIGLTFLLLGLVIFLHRLRKCPHHFGYLASYPKKARIPEKCLICPKIVACSAIAGARESDQPQKQKPLTKSTAMKEKDSSKCPHHFGFLRSLPNNQAVPQECITCQKLLECRNPI